MDAISDARCVAPVTGRECQIDPRVLSYTTAMSVDWTSAFLNLSLTTNMSPPHTTQKFHEWLTQHEHNIFMLHYTYWVCGLYFHTARWPTTWLTYIYTPEWEEYIVHMSIMKETLLGLPRNPYCMQCSVHSTPHGSLSSTINQPGKVRITVTTASSGSSHLLSSLSLTTRGKSEPRYGWSLPQHFSRKKNPWTRRRQSVSDIEQDILYLGHRYMHSTVYTSRSDMQVLYCTVLYSP